MSGALGINQVVVLEFLCCLGEFVVVDASKDALDTLVRDEEVSFGSPVAKDFDGLKGVVAAGFLEVGPKM